jgi:hypothetical protein
MDIDVCMRTHTRTRARTHTHTHGCRATFRNGTAEPAFRSRAERRGRTSQRGPRRTPGTSSVASRLREPATATGTSSYPPAPPRLSAPVRGTHARTHAGICTYASKHSPSMHAHRRTMGDGTKLQAPLPRGYRNWAHPRSHLDRNWAHPRSHLDRNWAHPRSHLDRDWAHPRSHPHRDWAHPCPHLHRGWAHPRSHLDRNWAHPRSHPHRDWAYPCPHLHRGWAHPRSHLDRNWAHPRSHLHQD